MALGQNYYGLFFQGGDPLGMAETELQYPGQLGLQSRTQCRDNIDRDLQIVQCDSTLATAPTAGMVAFWTADAEELGNYRVTTDAAARGRVAGVFGANIPTLLVDQYTAIVKKGRKVPVLFVDSPSSAPDATHKFVIASATAGKADAVATSEAADWPMIGVTQGTQDVTTKLADCEVDVYGSAY
jgi:hypothetical protein